ncbi:hypothetical protein MRX96_001873 [Rhipicephalus microplus]
MPPMRGTMLTDAQFSARRRDYGEFLSLVLLAFFSLYRLQRYVLCSGHFFDQASVVYTWKQPGRSERHTSVPFVSVTLPYGLKWDSFHLSVRVRSPGEFDGSTF